MKNYSLFLLLILFSLTSFAQNAAKNDVILQLNGDELTGKVIEITSDAVKFSYVGETLSYTIKKSDILKITYASGRIEVFNKPQLSSGQASSASASSGGAMEDHHNKVAVLPFAFIKDGQRVPDEMTNAVQNACYTYLTKHAGVFAILDTRTTNAKLLKAGVTRDNIQGYTMDDVCNILGVEYVVDGTVLLNKASVSSFGSTGYTDKTKQTNAKDSKSSGYASSSATTYENYETTINLDVYNDKGNNMFSQSRKSFFNTQDAYQSALEYVLKRSPLYSK